MVPSDSVTSVVLSGLYGVREPSFHILALPCAIRIPGAGGGEGVGGGWCLPALWAPDSSLILLRISHAHPHTGYELNELMCRNSANNGWHARSSWLVKWVPLPSLPLTWPSPFLFPFPPFLLNSLPSSPFPSLQTLTLKSLLPSLLSASLPSFFILFSSLKPPLHSQPSLWLVQPWHGGYWMPAKFLVEKHCDVWPDFLSLQTGDISVMGSLPASLRPQAKKKKK